MDNFRQDPMKGLPGVVVNLIADGRAYEFKRGVRERSRLRGMLLDLANIVATSPLTRGNLVLIEPELSSEAISDAWASVKEVFRTDLVERLAMVEARGRGCNGELIFFPADLPEKEKERIAKLIEQRLEVAPPPPSQSPGNSTYEVLRILMLRWLIQIGPLTIKELGEQAGYTYKPIRLALDGLRKHVFKHSRRGFELISFPREAWARLVLDAPALRGTIRFTTRGDHGRTPEALLKRFYRLGLEDAPGVAIGGVEGARHWAPNLDLLGLPRLDLTMHCPTGSPDLSFVRKLDPALVPATDRDSSSSLAIHLLHRKASYFAERFADPVECLLDLLEMRLEAQARQLLRSFTSTQGEDF